MKKTYYLYAGYYELHVSAHKLNEPFVFISKHKKIETTIKAAEKYDPDVCIVAYKDTVKDIAKYYGIDEENSSSLFIANEEVAA